MEFGLAIIGNLNQEKTDLIVRTSDELNVYFLERSYGSGVESIAIGVICVSREFDAFFPQKKIKYTKGKKVIHPNGVPFLLQNSIEYDIKIDQKLFLNNDLAFAEKLLKLTIIKSVDILDNIKITDFDIEKFKTDLILFLDSTNKCNSI